jgi:FeS assembly SUF system regulator
MVRLGKLTDYGLVLMTCMARSYSSPLHGSQASPHATSLNDSPASSLRNARDLAAESKLPISTVSKLLKHLLQSGLLTSHRGTKGGYLLARDPREISVLEVIAAVEGPMALTECSTDVSGLCQIELGCPIKTNQRIINQAVRGVLEKVMLSDLANPMQLTSITDAHGRLVPTIASAIQ